MHMKSNNKQQTDICEGDLVTLDLRWVSNNTRRYLNSKNQPLVGIVTSIIPCAGMYESIQKFEVLWENNKKADHWASNLIKLEHYVSR